MAKLSQKQRAAIQGALRELDRGIAYLLSETTAVCRVADRATTGLDFTRNLSPEAAGVLLTETQRKRSGGNYALTEVAKEYGSNLTGVFEAKRQLEQFLKNDASRNLSLGGTIWAKELGINQ